MQKKFSQVALIVLDGWGYREAREHNAIALAKKPFYDSLWNDYPHNLLQASGASVGLPEGEMGNSEVGHNVMGAGRIVESDILRINKSIQEGVFGSLPPFKRLFDHVIRNKSTLHVNGLVSSGGVHSHEDHLYAFLHAAKAAGIRDLAVHAFTDGMDTGPHAAVDHIKKLENFLRELGIGKIATVSGRYYAMDRDNNWDRVQKVEDALFECKGNVCHVANPSEMLQSLYEKKVDDMHISPIVCLDYEGQGCAIKDNDGLFFFNFRPDRARMLSHKVAERAKKSNIHFLTMTQYDDILGCDVVFSPVTITNSLGEILSKHNLSQVRIAESEKYAHATYFLNAGHEDPYDGQRNILVPSSKNVESFDMDPEMMAKEISEKAAEEVRKGTNFIFVNFANPDVVGHTGNEEATILAIEAVDSALEPLVSEIVRTGGIAIITSDHGNAEIKYDQESKAVSVTHTSNPVPIIITAKEHTVFSGGLRDIAPTVLSLFNIKIPLEMTGSNLLGAGVDN